MNFYTKSWKDYIYSNYKRFINDYITTIYDEVLNKKTKYTDILNYEFDNYYNAKKEYKSNYDLFKKEFGNYEKIKLFDYKKEFTLYKNRLNRIVNNLLNEIKDIYNINDNEIINEVYLFCLGKNIENNKIDRKYLYNKFENVNAFLSSYKDYYNTLKDKFDDDLVFNHSFHDGEVIEIKKINNDTILTIDDIDNNRYIFRIENCKINTIYSSKQNTNMTTILKFDCFNFEDIKYYIYLDTQDSIKEFLSSKVTINIIKK